MFACAEYITAPTCGHLYPAPRSQHTHLLTLNPMPLQPYLRRIIEGHETLSRADSAELLRTILRGESTELELAALLGSLATRGPAATEIAGFVDAMRSAATRVPLTDAERSSSSTPAAPAPTPAAPSTSPPPPPSSPPPPERPPGLINYGRQTRQPRRHLRLRLGRRPRSPRHPHRPLPRPRRRLPPHNIASPSSTRPRCTRR